MPVLSSDLKIVIVSEHASAKFGGEAALPLHYFRLLRQRGFPVRLVVHSRTRDELTALFPGDKNIHFMPDTWFHVLLYHLSRFLPHRLAHFSTGYLMRISSQLAQRREVRRLVSEGHAEIVHQPMPVSPREPSVMYGLGVPVVIGPMNGGIDFPPAFAHLESRMVSTFVSFGRRASNLLNRLMPGKLRCAVNLVANERTRRALPSGLRGEVIELVENGVDLMLWAKQGVAPRPDTAATRLVFLGRLVEWKGVDHLLKAFAAAAVKAPVSLTVVGDGPERSRLEEFACSKGLFSAGPPAPGQVFFAGWRSQAECAQILCESDILVLPSLMECGGAVVLEAMAAGRAVIATDWGGPADYLDASCGILVPPTSTDAFIAGLEVAITSLAQSPERRLAMGLAGHRKVIEQYDWEIKIDRMLSIYRDAIAAHKRASASRRTTGA